jgi:ribokinase
MAGKKIIVFGSYVTDLTSHSPQLPVPGETLKGISFKNGPGGKGSNQAVAANRAGADVLLITKLGEDVFGEMAKDFYVSENMMIDGIFTDKEYSTGCALIMVGDDTAQNLIVVIPGACEHFSKEDLKVSRKYIDEADILLTQLETNYEASSEMLRYAKSKGCLTVLNPAPSQTLDDEILSNVDIITPNETEATILTKIIVDDKPENARAAAERFMERGVKKVIITLGANGVYGTDGREELFWPAKAPAPVVDTTGAGDAFNGGFVAGLSFGYDFFEAIRYGSVIGGLAVTRFGTAPAMPYSKEIAKYYCHKE